MALYGSSRDISFFHVINTELLHNIIEQNVGYYQISLDETPTNVYGEAKDGTKMYLSPVLIVCLIDRGDYEGNYSTLGPDFTRNFSFRFLRRDLVDQNVVPQIGDVVLWNNDTSAFTNYQLAAETPKAVSKVIQSNYPNVIKGRLNLANIVGQTSTQYKSDDRFQALATADPTENIILHTIMCGADGLALTTSTAYMQVMLNFHVEWFDQHPVAQS